MRKPFIIIICLINILILSGCTAEDPYYPGYYPMTKWQSDDQRIVFFVDDMRNCLGTIKTEKQEFNFFMELSPSGNLIIYNKEMYFYPYIESSDYWEKFDNSDGAFKIEVMTDNFFKTGEIIEIKLTEKNILPEDIPPLPEKPDNYDELLENRDIWEDKFFEKYGSSSGT